MTTIQAWQHIYSNVEKEQSPKNRGGFQTLFYTQDGLTADEVSEMEGRLLYFPSKTGEPVKRVFFTTTTGKVVIAQIVVLPDPDQFGRKGRYLAHALAFNEDDLLKIEVDPFRVFRSFTFFNTVEQALAQGNFESGDFPAASVDVTRVAGQESRAAAQWPAGELAKLALLALRVDRQTAGREAITVAGTEAEIETAIEAAFLAVPAAMRSHCTFDTYFYRCNLVATFYWAIGLPEMPVSIKFVAVDGAARQVQGAAPTQPETAYERWAVAALDNKKFDRLVQSRDQAFAVAEWLEGRPYDQALLDAAAPRIVEEVFEVNPATVQAALRRAVGQHLPEVLIDRAADQIDGQASPQDCYHHLRQGFTMS
ncbi:MAG: hypothetical protein R3264_10895, partial [Anaerolineae bacterium]|nr:hypothetical protein [Anaerolineae bacterium]